MDLGAELSATHVYDMVWLGGYLDFTRDFGRTAWKLTLGPEVGYSFFGIDGGPMLLVDAGGVSTGVAIRGFLTVGFIALYVRGEWLLTHRTGSQTDIGVLLKWPLYSSDDWMAYF